MDTALGYWPWELQRSFFPLLCTNQSNLHRKLFWKILTMKITKILIYVFFNSIVRSMHELGQPAFIYDFTFISLFPPVLSFSPLRQATSPFSPLNLERGNRGAKWKARAGVFYAFMPAFHFYLCFLNLLSQFSSYSFLKVT